MEKRYSPGTGTGTGVWDDAGTGAPVPVAAGVGAVELLDSPTASGAGNNNSRTGVNIMTVHNVLASAGLGPVKLDLDRICANFGNAYYNPEDFRATRIDVRGRCGSFYTISLFENGKIQSTGGCWPEEAKRSMKKVARKLLYKLGYADVKFEKFEVQNILAVIDVGHNINLHKLCELYRNVDYEPERFPVARIRVPMPARPVPPPTKKTLDLDIKRTAARINHQPKEEVVSVNVFSTGKITFTGGKSIESIQRSLNEVRPFVQMSKL